MQTDRYIRLVLRVWLLDLSCFRHDTRSTDRKCMNQKKSSAHLTILHDCLNIIQLLSSCFLSHGPSLFRYIHYGAGEGQVGCIKQDVRLQQVGCGHPACGMEHRTLWPGIKHPRHHTHSTPHTVPPHNPPHMTQHIAGEHCQSITHLPPSTTS